MLENKLFEALLDVIPFKAYAVDIETYEVVYANKLMRENMFAPQEQYCWEKVFGQEQICSWCNINKLKLRDKRENAEKLICEFFDETDDRWIKAYDELMSWPDGRDVKYSILVDITDQKDIQGDMIKSHAKLAMHSKRLKSTNKNLQITKLQLQKTINQLEEEKSKAQLATTSKSKFLANMSHEIRTPMNAVIGMTHLLSQTKLDEQQQSYVKKIELSSKNLLNIIHDILDFSKIEAGRLELENIDFNINDIIDNTSSTLEQKALEKNLDFNIFKNLHNQNEIFFGDPFRISQILINLIGNAIKFTHEGKVEVNIKSMNNNRMLFEIIDTGIGLSDEEIEKLFESFTQANSSTSRKFGGSGLGLTISQQLSHLMDGEICIESQKGIGSKFILDIYLPKGNEKNIKYIDETILMKLQQNLYKLKGSHILVAEDNQLNQEIIRSLIEQYGINVTIVNNGQELIDALKDSPDKYELIFMDIQMPIINGLEATTLIRKTNKDITIVGLSANAMKKDVEIAKDCGMNEYLTKPIEVDKLYSTLLKFIKPKDTSYKIEKDTKEKEINFPKLTYINTQKGLSYFLNNQDLYIKILKSFYNDYKNLKIESLDEKEQDNIFHTIKGLSSNIGAMSLYELAKKIENDKNEKLITQFFQELNVVCMELKTLDFDKSPIDNSLPTINTIKKEELFFQLKNAINTNRPKKCIQVIDEIEQYKLDTDDNKLFESIKMHIQNFNYEKANELLG